MTRGRAAAPPQPHERLPEQQQRQRCAAKNGPGSNRHANEERVYLRVVAADAEARHARGTVRERARVIRLLEPEQPQVVDDVLGLDARVVREPRSTGWVDQELVG